MTDPDGIGFTAQTPDGPVRAVLSLGALRSLSGRSHVSGQELLAIYRVELEAIVTARVRRDGRGGVIRIEAGDL